jgi:hypothetical protein
MEDVFIALHFPSPSVLELGMMDGAPATGLDNKAMLRVETASGKM